MYIYIYIYAYLYLYIYILYIYIHKVNIEYKHIAIATLVGSQLMGVRVPWSHLWSKLHTQVIVFLQWTRKEKNTVYHRLSWLYQVVLGCYIGRFFFEWTCVSMCLVSSAFIHIFDHWNMPCLTGALWSCFFCSPGVWHLSWSYTWYIYIYIFCEWYMWTPRRLPKNGCLGSIFEFTWLLAACSIIWIEMLKPPTS